MSSLEFQTVIALTGPVYLGNTFNWFLLGMLTLQVLGTIYTLELFHGIFILLFGWYYTVSGWGQTEAISRFPWPGLAQPIITGIRIVQIFYAWRVWTLNQNSILTSVVAILIVLLALLSSVTSITAGIMFCFVKDISGEVKLTPAVNASFTLVQARRRTTFKKTEKLITRLVIAAIETGTVTAVTATVDLILFLLFPNLNYHLCPSLMLSQLYSNTALASLNDRRDPSGSQASTYSFHIGSGTHRRALHESHHLGSLSLSNDLELGTVHVSTTTEVVKTVDFQD
ncbi:hypothetical protein EV368DRAFT_65554 [Lentinula lateritia]|uniref:Uncharacterized protein n=1 Tax=Lentinula aff. lateritia TaxID=2804960 RepID=A0ACC1TRE2_9AGAR|nr:hypothetical protein F5876DRAFT_68240 [Lentinula aff. lateritia]KAJ3851684.1 hypothetical protein EV368DRAFT_65554 [Lentinula lateritia]